MGELIKAQQIARVKYVCVLFPFEDTVEIELLGFSQLSFYSMSQIVLLYAVWIQIWNFESVTFENKHKH